MSKAKSADALKEKAKVAANKPAALGEDLDLSKFASEAEPLPYRADHRSCHQKLRSRCLRWGYARRHTAEIGHICSS